MADRPVLIVSDSRGRLLDQALKNTLTDIPFHHVWQNGLRLSHSADFVTRVVLEMKPKLIYFLNGICDVTHIIHREPWTVAMRNISPEITCNNYMYAVDQLHASMFNLSSQVGHFLMIIFTSQTGIDIGKYNHYPDELISPEQKYLNKAILKINNNIQRLNKSVNVVTPFLASAVHTRCRGKHRMVSSKLEDGCHPSFDLCTTWANKLKANIIVNFSKYDHYSLTNQMYT